VLIGCFITGAFFVMSIACFYLVKNRHVEFARRSIKVSLPIAVIFSLLAMATASVWSFISQESLPG
jgi:cytochrome bd ubiquinol oxidase subunit I